MQLSPGANVKVKSETGKYGRMWLPHKHPSLMWFTSPSASFRGKKANVSHFVSPRATRLVLNNGFCCIKHRGLLQLHQDGMLLHCRAPSWPVPVFTSEWRETMQRKIVLSKSVHSGQERFWNTQLQFASVTHWSLVLKKIWIYQLSW